MSVRLRNWLSLLRAGLVVIVAGGLVLAGGLWQPLGLGRSALLHAQESTVNIPGPWRSAARIPKPDLTGLERIRFLTEAEYPPFNYYDQSGQLAGFNIDLARAICDVLAVQCEFQVQDWDDLIPVLNKGDGDAIIASLSISKQTLRQVDFTDRYYQTPARFVARVSEKLQQISPDTLAGKKVAVVQGTAHEAYLRDFFPKAKIIPFEELSEAQEALKSGFVDFLFGDGITLVFWLNGKNSEQCCDFRGGPYTETRYFGEGVAIAVKKGDRRMRTILNYALNLVHQKKGFKGSYKEYFIKHFPRSFY